MVGSLELYTHNNTKGLLMAVSKRWFVLMFEEYPLPQIPKDTPSLGWRHSRDARAVLEFQSGKRHFGSSPRHPPGLNRSEHPADRAYTLSCMHAAEPEEQLPLLYQVPLQRVLNWNRWWHIVARYLLRALQRRYWGLLGNHLKTVKGVVNPHLAQVRRTYGRGQGRLLQQLSETAPK